MQNRLFQNEPINRVKSWTLQHQSECFSDDTVCEGRWFGGHFGAIWTFGRIVVASTQNWQHRCPRTFWTVSIPEFCWVMYSWFCCVAVEMSFNDSLWLCCEECDWRYCSDKWNSKVHCCRSARRVSLRGSRHYIVKTGRAAVGWTVCEIEVKMNEKKGSFQVVTCGSSKTNCSCDRYEGGSVFTQDFLQPVPWGFCFATGPEDLLLDYDRFYCLICRVNALTRGD